MKTVHLIGNAHLDPVWLWPRAQGVDAVLATARSAADLLEEYGEFIFTASSSWFHQVIERHDPGLFERVRGLVAAGRWQVVGGMVIEPDCNFPTPESFARQFQLAQRYFRRKLGRPATVGYNIDSFGHSAYLPRFLRQAGLDCYVFMRPGPHEKQLPANLFRWQSPDGHEVTAFRIIGGYGAGGPDLRDHVQNALDAMPAGVEHTMAFFGVGDHGGGPTRAQIQWILEHAHDIPGARLVMSHPRAFFDAVAPQAGMLPVVVGELQHHAIGCYSVERRIKVAMRRAEARLVQAETAIRHFPPAAATARQVRQSIHRAWEAVLLNQFHDVLGGTSIDDASQAAAGEIGAAEAAAEEVIALLTRRACRQQAAPGRHRIAAFNLAAEPFDGLIAHEPYFQGQPVRELAVLDEQDRPVPHQIVEPRAKVNWTAAVLLRLSIPAGGRRLLRVVPDAGRQQAAPAASALEAGPACLASPQLRAESEGEAIRLGDWTVRLEVQDDPSDTWSHGYPKRFDGRRAGCFDWAGRWEAVETGPLRAAVRRPARFGDSRLWCRMMLGEGEPMLRLHFSVVWSQPRQMLRLRVAGPEIDRRSDWVSGGPLDRPVNGLEYPIHGVVWVGAGDESLGLVAPEVFSAAVEPAGVSLTLLRSPYLAHHDPTPAEPRIDHPVADQGRHEFDVSLWPGCPAGPAEAARLARHMLAPPVVFDLSG